MKKKTIIAFAVVGAVTVAVLTGAALVIQKGNVKMTNKDFLRAEGKELRNEKGETVYLKGINIGNYFVQEFWMGPTEYTGVTCQKELEEKLTERFGAQKKDELIKTYQDNYFTEKDFDKIKKLGFNSIRIPFWYGTFSDDEGNWKKDAFDRLDWFVEQSAKRGIYVILDMHGAFGSQNGSDHSGIDGRDDKKSASKFFFGDDAEKNQKMYYEMWEKIAEHYKENPTVAGYDLLNEPYCTYRYSSGLSDDELHTVLWNIYDAAYDRIRAIDDKHIIIMEATWDSYDLPNPKKYDWENVMYEYHNYEYSNYDNENDAQINSMQRKITDVKTSGYNVPVYMGEFNYFNNMEAWTKGLKLLDDNGFNWSIWSYKCMDDNDNWGVEKISLNKVDIEKDSFETIKETWSKVGESEENTKLVDAIRESQK
ncbi:MAG: cellulase family glycosylhydrolase [Lachnospiraceae bacterium]|nr:cellulase family glycosylhydrolase [Lachnospiraceae bacterium]